MSDLSFAQSVEKKLCIQNQATLVYGNKGLDLPTEVYVKNERRLSEAPYAKSGFSLIAFILATVTINALLDRA